MNTSARDLKALITESLKSFNKGALLKNATALFNTLGYHSDKTFELSPNSAENFLFTFDEKNSFRRDNAFCGRWQSIDIIFQLTDEEIYALGSGQRSIQFDAHKKIDNKIIESYLFIALQLKKGHYTRTDLSTITREINKLFPMPVFVLFKIEENLTLAVINRRLHKRDVSRDVLEKVTLIKDIRFADPHRAHIEILYDLSFEILYDRYRFTSFVNLHKAWRETLDNEELNKRFYKELANWYFWALREVTFPSQNDIAEDIRNPISVIRLITRIIFVWFVKEKGLIPEAIFQKREIINLLKNFSPESSSYYKAILQNLFFATLNTKMGKRKFRDQRRFQGKNNSYMLHNFFRYGSFFEQSAAILELLNDTPFLNGGLFECLDRESEPITRIDGFSDRADNELHVPNHLFFADEQFVDLNKDYGTKGKKHRVRGLINLLQSYKFTITENTPIEEEIALDPELLGRVFENLLASYNPETQTTARKLTGSFYTPREIVNYMVDESLIAYLENILIRNYEKQLELEAKNPQSQQKIFGKQDHAQIKLVPAAIKIPEEKRKQNNENLSHLFTYNDETPRFDTIETGVLIHAIDNMKILDPACGSGAFPMGILHRLVFVLHKLDPENRQWKNKQIAKAEQIEVPSSREAAIHDIELAFEKNKLDYARKLYLIQNCIFGVDIQPVAVQIAKLRFFISLIVEQNIDDKADNRGMMPLPNLETKIVSANTLIGFKGDSPLKGSNIVDLENELKTVRRQYFDARSRKKKRQCEERDKVLREKISQLIKRQDYSQDADINLDKWDPYNQNESADFFDPEWMFGEKQGFDIVIGNPPYVRQEKIKDLKPVFKNQYECYTGTADLYVYFYERGFDLIRAGGILTYISSNKYFRSAYGKKLRKFLGTRSSIHQLIDFGDAPVFTSIAYPSIIILEKMGKGVSDSKVRNMMFGEQNKKELDIKALNWQAGPPIESFPEIFSHQKFSLSQSALTEDGWRLEPPEVQRLLEKLQTGGEPLGEFVDGKFYYGIKTGLNEAFVVDHHTRNCLIEDDPACSVLFKPFLRGQNVKRWKVEFDHEYLIKIESSTNKKHPWSDKPNEKAEKLFASTYPSIYRHFQGFRDRLMNRDDKGKYYWELRSCKYWDAFESSKVIYPDIAKKPEFAFDDEAYYLANTLYLIPTDKKWLVGLLNSSIVFWIYTKLSASIRGGFVRFFTQYVSQIPLPTHDQNSFYQDRILISTSKLSLNSSEKLSRLEPEIDAWIAHLYKLSEAEYLLVLRETNMPDPFRISALNLFRDIAKGKIK